MRAASTSRGSRSASLCPTTRARASSTALRSPRPARWASMAAARNSIRAVRPLGRMSELASPSAQPRSRSSDSACVRMFRSSGSSASSMRRAMSRASRASAHAWSAWTGAPPMYLSMRVRAEIWASATSRARGGHSTSIANPIATTETGVLAAAVSAIRACGPNTSAAHRVRWPRSSPSTAAHAARVSTRLTSSTRWIASSWAGSGSPRRWASRLVRAWSAVRTPAGATGQPRAGRCSRSATAGHRPSRRSAGSMVRAPVISATAFQSSGRSTARPWARSITASPRSCSVRSVRITRKSPSGRSAYSDSTASGETPGRTCTVRPSTLRVAGPSQRGCAPRSSTRALPFVTRDRARSRTRPRVAGWAPGMVAVTRTTTSPSVSCRGAPGAGRGASR